MKLLVAFAPADVPMIEQTRVDGVVLAFSAATAIAGGLLVGVGRLVRTFGALSRVDYGYEPDRLLAASLDLGSERYAGTARQVAFMDRLVERVSALPGVTDVAVSSEAPVVGYQVQFRFELEGRPRPETDPREDDVYVQAVSPGSLRALGLPLVRGRGIESRDRAGAGLVAVVNRELARRIFGGDDPIGHRVSFGGADGPWFEIVGVAGDARYRGLDVPPRPILYLPLAQKPWSWMTALTLLVRTGGEPADLVADVRRRLLELDDKLPLQRAVPVADLYAANVARRRLVPHAAAGLPERGRGARRRASGRHSPGRRAGDEADVCGHRRRDAGGASGDARRGSTRWSH